MKYTVFIRVPFPRGSFVDPTTANWNTAKEDELWSMLNSTPKNAGIDWDDLAEHFDASPSFLLQQAAWLYERQLSHVREHLSIKHMKPAGVQSSTTPPGGQPMRRAGSGQGPASRAPSALSVRPKHSSELRREASLAGPTTPPPQRARTFSRTISATTITQLPHSQSSHASPKQKQRMSSNEQAPGSPLSFTGALRSDSDDNSSSSEAGTTIAHSRLYARRPRFPPAAGKGKAPLNTLSSADEGSEDDAPSFLPFSALPDGEQGQSVKVLGKTKEFPPNDLAADLREAAMGRHIVSEAHGRASASSSGTLSSPNQQSPSLQSTSSPRDPKSIAEGMRGLSALSPRQRKFAKEAGSEGTPSMGSSFSDFDDTSISRSAMEEALAREMQAGKASMGVASRIGGLWKQSGAGASASRKP